LRIVSQQKTNALLGYPDDARLLIVNADDFGMCHSNNAATIRAFREGILTSATLMVSCSWAPEAMALLWANPDLPFGVHLTIVSEHDAMRWGPRASRDRVQSLIDDEGYFFRNSQAAALMAQAKLAEVETEYRAQIDTVFGAGLQPTHLDWHCLYDGGRPDIFELTVALAREYGLAMRVHDQSRADALAQGGLPVVDRGVLDSYSLDVEDKVEHYIQLLRDLPSGLSEWAVHPRLGDAEAQAMEPDAWQVRKTDFAFLISREAREVLADEGIILLGYRELGAARSH
jgi:predicted glycoside hydrolase/deacetylase ChbG (UPF0249 family)